MSAGGGVRPAGGGGPQRLLSRSTQHHIDDVFSRAEGDMPLHFAAEELAARTAFIDTYNGSVKMPSDELVANAAESDEWVSKGAFTAYVVAQLQQFAKYASGAHRGVRFVPASEYLTRCMRCQSGVPDARGITRYWAGLDRVNPRISLPLVVSIVTALGCVAVLGPLLGLERHTAGAEAERASKAALDVLTAASDAFSRVVADAQAVETMSAAMQPLNASVSALIATAAADLTRLSAMCTQQFVGTATDTVGLQLDALDSSVATQLRTLLELAAVMRLTGVALTAELASWVGRQPAAGVRAAVWLPTANTDAQSGGSASLSWPLPVLWSDGAAAANCSTPSSLCARLAADTRVVDQPYAAFSVLLESGAAGTMPGESRTFRVLCARFRTSPVSTAAICLAVRQRVLPDVRLPNGTLFRTLAVAGSAANSAIVCQGAATSTGGALWFALGGETVSPTGDIQRLVAAADVAARASLAPVRAIDGGLADVAVDFAAGSGQGRASVRRPLVAGSRAATGAELYVECVFDVNGIASDASDRLRGSGESGVALASRAASPLAFPVDLDRGLPADPQRQPWFVLATEPAVGAGAMLGSVLGVPSVVGYAHLSALGVGVVVSRASPRDGHPASDDSANVAATAFEELLAMWAAALPGATPTAPWFDVHSDGVAWAAVSFGSSTTSANDAALAFEFVAGEPALMDEPAVVDAVEHAMLSRARSHAYDAGTEVDVVADYLGASRSVFVMARRTAIVDDDVWLRIGVSAAVAVALIAIVVVLVVVVSAVVFRGGDRRQHDDRLTAAGDAAIPDTSAAAGGDGSGAANASSEQQRVTQLQHVFRESMPATVLSRFRAGEKLISDYYPQLTFFMSDIVSFTEKTKYMSNAELVRFLGYTFMLLDYVAEYYDVHKVKSIGDAFFAVSGLEDRHETGGGGARQQINAAGMGASIDDRNAVMASVASRHQSTQHHQTYRMMAFASVCQMLLTPLFLHHPERTECFDEVAGGVKQPPFRCAPCRIGVHVGPAYAGVFDGGRAPQFDCIGQSVGICSMLEAGAAAGTIRISEAVKRILSQVDIHRDFVCSSVQRTLAKNQGRIDSYTVVATFLGVPQAIIDGLHIDRSVKRRAFGENGLILEEVDFASGGGHRDRFYAFGEEAESTMLSEDQEQHQFEASSTSLPH